ncbi:aspartate-semialdehyde dehydrogenase [Thalassospira alkalitolerans]|uniref:Aspartate-semialdehyde dehydrogenase n=1 Tax=Thalassospira alkalitolerans TaxID=1293890 RepID=A0A1Y2LGT4_9PROT|nr:aspartate-semialdehyde dehydrogenase [Thalassospira alkalitolerans]OSQ50417.1 aspartate-semialdehyde dehydrogenase [Thalassospira alkalitolerans]|tara:strand:+ start:34627 stop:35634 length:1008 start_codon:yes stop_codon:yes gene_type:complete
MSAENLHVGVIGATGAVGVELINVMFDRNFPVGELTLFASERSAGKTMETKYGTKTIALFSVEEAKQCDIVFLAVSGDFAKEFAPQIAKGALVIDNSSAFRMDDDVPLIVPEINGALAKTAKLIANPNCTTAIAAVALWPLHQAFGLKKVIVSTYQAASGAGQPGMNELREGLAAGLEGKPVSAEVFAHPLAFNVIPHIDSFQENGYTREEMKVTWETRKIFGEPNLAVSCTAVRIPIERTHSEAIVIETEKVVTPAAAREALAKAKGVKLVDDPANNVYPMPINATKQYDVEVGRIRTNLIFGDHGLELFVAGDQLLKGAALNAVQIAEAYIAD